MRIKTDLFKISGFKKKLFETFYTTKDPEVFVKDVINNEYYKVTNIRLFHEVDDRFSIIGEDEIPRAEVVEEIIIEVKKITDLEKGEMMN